MLLSANVLALKSAREIFSPGPYHYGLMIVSTLIFFKIVNDLLALQTLFETETLLATTMPVSEQSKIKSSIKRIL